MADKVKFELVSPEKLLLSEDVAMVVVPGGEGNFGVLPGHALLISTVRPGIIDVYQERMTDISQRIFVSGGFAEVTPERCTVLADEALPVAEIDRGAAEAEAKEFEGRLADLREIASRAAGEDKIEAQVNLRAAELVARCIVETGTSSYYTALAEAADEPVLKIICRKIAADELRHYKLFYDHMKRYLACENLGLWGRLRVALGRIRESEDDELSYAYFAANLAATGAYDRKRANGAYLKRAYAIYRPHHVERAVAMSLKAVGLKPHGWLTAVTTKFAWRAMRRRARRLANA